MLPLIVIGATQPIRAALEPYAQVGHIEHHPTAEDAHFALTEAATTPGQSHVGVHVHPLHGKAIGVEPSRWEAHVAYGPEAYGPIVVGGTRPGVGRLSHSGHTLVLGWQVDPDPGRSRRVRGGAVTGADPDTLAWQVAVALSADVVVDLGQSAGLPFLIRYLEWKSAGVCQS